MNTTVQPIGIFDSGAGGLSVLKELVKLLPKESFIYFADSANCPYGQKNQSEIIKLANAIVQFLIGNNVKLIVVACNTATAAAIDFLRERYSIPFIGMEPAIKPASLNTKTKSIGVLATAGTFKGRLYAETSKKYASNIKICYKVGEGLVELVENGHPDSPEAVKLLHKYVDPMLACKIDHLVLGCTHYPFLINAIKQIAPPNLTIIDPAPAVAKQTKKILEERGLINKNIPASINFYSSGKTDVIKNIINLFEVVPNGIPMKFADNITL
ncbi:MAG TPA: glutamate racemase [Tenuifilaceae bacterium]|nr:glutamate racemase [Tenuifilaceae bacterium]